MASPNTPFLSAEDRLESNMDVPEHETKGSSRNESPHMRRLYSTTQITIFLLAAWGFVSLCLEATQQILTQQPLHAASNVPDPYHPETLEPGRNICDCGSTIAEALARDCVYDTMATAWLPPYCRDEELTAEFDRSGPGLNGAWSYFADKDGRIPLNKTEMGALGETGGTFWASRDWHIVHCLFYWQKYWRMRDTGAVMEARFDKLSHVKHCSGLIRNPVPDHFFLLEVPVTMNSSEEAGK